MSAATVNRLLVVGGSGFIGRHLCRAASASGYSVTSLSLAAPAERVPGIDYRTADISDSSAVRASLDDGAFEYVVNCGGYIDHRLFRNGGRDLIRSHFDGVQNVVETIDRECLVRFIQLGSSDEYGNAAAPQHEELREQPIAPYSLGKVSATHFLQMMWRTERFPATVLRLFLTYGPGQDQKRFLPQLIKGCLADARFPVSEGHQLRDFCYIDDVMSGILRALQLETACGEVINLASGIPVSIRAVVEAVRTLVGKGEPEFGRIAYRAGENMALYASIEKARSMLNWAPAVPLMEGLARTVAFYRDGQH